MAAGRFHGTVDFGGETRTGDLAAVLLRVYPKSPGTEVRDINLRS
jgi:hypothetical protein